jgi:hypothetical protein
MASQTRSLGALKRRVKTISRSVVVATLRRGLLMIFYSFPSLFYRTKTFEIDIHRVADELSLSRVPKLPLEMTVAGNLRTTN